MSTLGSKRRPTIRPHPKPRPDHMARPMGTRCGCIAKRSRPLAGGTGTRRSPAARTGHSGSRGARDIRAWTGGWSTWRAATTAPNGTGSRSRHGRPPRPHGPWWSPKRAWALVELHHVSDHDPCRLDAVGSGFLRQRVAIARGAGTPPRGPRLVCRQLRRARVRPDLCVVVELEKRVHALRYFILKNFVTAYVRRSAAIRSYVIWRNRRATPKRDCAIEFNGRNRPPARYLNNVVLKRHQ
jgi:hypothetical protein